MRSTINAYEPLIKIVNGWADGRIGLVTLIGSPGSGKSQAAKKAAAGRAVIIEGQMSALGLYEQVYLADGRPILIDDVDSIYEDPSKVSILKCLCQTDPVKRITWHKASAYLAKREIPNEFETTSNVMIIGNEWRNINRNVAAVVDRGLAIEFAPTPAALHAEVGKWFDDMEIYEHIGEILRFVEVPSMRPYLVCRQLRALGVDWKAALQESYSIDEKLFLAYTIIADPAFATSAQQVEEFMARNGGSRATFFRLKKELEVRGL